MRKSGFVDIGYILGYELCLLAVKTLTRHTYPRKVERRHYYTRLRGLLLHTSVRVVNFERKLYDARIKNI